MVRKLLFLSTKRTELRLLRNALLIAGGCLFTAAFSFVWWSIIVAVVIALVGYHSIAERHAFRISYWLLIILFTGAFSLAFQPSIAHSIGGLIPYATYLICATLLFLIIGISRSVFRSPTSLYALVNTALIFGLLLASYLFVWRGGTGAPIVALLIAVGASALLIREALVWYGLPQKNAKFIAYALGVVIGELYLVLSFLPLGPFNTAAFLTLVAFFGRDAFVALNRGTLSMPFALRSLTFFVLITIVILGVSPWSI